MVAKDIDIGTRSDEVAELAYWHALYPQFKGWRPTDAVSHMQAIMNPGTADIRNYTAVYHSYQRLKEAEFREKYLRWFAGLSLREKSVTSLIDSPDPKLRRNAARTLHTGMRQTFRGMVGVDRTWANTHLNASISHHLGALAYGLEVRAIVKLGEGEKGVHYGDVKRHYKILPFNDDCTRRYRMVHKVGILHGLYGVPRDADEWSKVVDGVSQGLGSLTENLGALGDVDAYRGSWCLRGSLIGDRTIAGAETFTVPAKMTVARFSKMFPDENDYMNRWAKELGVTTVKMLARKLKYVDGLEFLSMFACLLLDGRVREVAPETLRSSAVKKSILKKRRQMKNAYGHEGHPAVVSVEAARAVS